MANLTIRDALKLIKDNGEGNLGIGAAPKDIEAKQLELGLKFPASYIEFLKKYDGGEFAFGRMHSLEELSGYFEHPKLYVPELQDGELLPIGDDYSGEYYCIDYRSTQAGELPIVLCLQEHSIENVADSFPEYIAKSY